MYKRQGTLAAPVGFTGGNQAESSPPPKTRTDKTFGLLYETPPADKDDLSRLAGIDAAAAARLNAAGIYKFDQMKSLDDKQAMKLAEKFQLPDADPSDWRRCIYAWGRGINTTAEADQVYAAGSLHGVELPKITCLLYTSPSPRD